MAQPPCHKKFDRVFKGVTPKEQNMTQDYSVKVTIRNGRILSHMRALGIHSQADLARKAGTTIASVNAIIALRSAPAKQNGDWVEAVHRIAAVLNCEPEDLFTDVQKTLAIKQNSCEVYMSEPDVMRLTTNGSNATIDDAMDIQKLISLEPKERTRKIMEMRLQGATYEQCGEEVDLCKQRIIDIERRFIRETKSRIRRHSLELP
jgi:transcriptional regulator with XRE-family HTH domain